MPEQPQPQKSVVTVIEMARLVGLSRTRFRQLVASGVFPTPKRNAETGRPFFDAEGQQACFSVRAKNVGVNGQPILFYSRRPTAMPLKPSRRTVGAQTPRRSETAKATAAASGVSSPKPFAPLIDGLKQLGMAEVSESKVADALRVCFPGGADGTPSNQVLLAVFRHLVRRDSGENVGR